MTAQKLQLQQISSAGRVDDSADNNTMELNDSKNVWSNDYVELMNSKLQDQKAVNKNEDLK